MEQKYNIQNYIIKPDGQRTFYSGSDYLILLLTSGNCHVTLNSTNSLCTAADMILFKPHMSQVLSTTELQEPCTLISLHVSPQLLEQCSDEECNLREKYSFVPYEVAVIHGEISTVILLKNLISRLAGIRQEKLQLGLSIYENNLLSTFLVIFLRSCAQSDEVWRRRQKKDLLIDDIFMFIKEHLNEELTLKRLEKEFYVSGEHISRTFKKAAGISLHAYITKSRIDLSKKYILQGYPIQEIFGRCGFGSYNHFFKAFKKECGMTPKAYFHQMSDITHSLEANRIENKTE